MGDQVWIDLKLDTGKKVRVHAWPVKPPQVSPYRAPTPAPPPS